MTEISSKEKIARRVALELRDDTLVNLGIGLPTLIARHVPPGMRVHFQSENGIIGFGDRPPEGMEDIHLTDAGGAFVSAQPGASAFDSAMSFALIRGGHIDLTVLGRLQVDGQGRLANWMVPGEMIPGMGGAMDLAIGARQVMVAITHTQRGRPKIVKELTLPPTAMRAVDLIVTEMAVIAPVDGKLVLREVAPGVTAKEVQAATEAELVVDAELREMLGRSYEGTGS